MKTIKINSALAAFGLLVTLYGCGGGADSVPTITAKPKPVKTAATNGGNNGAPKNGPKGNGGGGGIGSFKGRIVYGGSAPAAGKPTGFNPADPKTDKFCVGIAAKINNESLLVGATGGVQNVVIYLKKKPAGYTATVPPTVKEFSNKNCMFSPRMMAVRVGRKIKIVNDDVTSHNTHLFPLNNLNPAFNGLIPKGESKEYQYNAKESLPVKVVCDIHGWMLAYHMPLDHEFFAVTDKDGNFEIKNLPAGSHQFVVWHERSGYLERRLKVSVQAGKETKIEKKYTPGKFTAFNGPVPKTIVLSLNK